MMELNQIAEIVGGDLFGDSSRVLGVSTDSRTLRKGDLFVALKGPSFDGHSFLESVYRSGAVGAITEQKIDHPIAQIVIKDTLAGLGQLGKYWRSQFDIPLVAVTGSNGKTTVKEMIGSILSTQATSLVSTGNLNNDIGLPLVLCRLRKEHKYAVVEMGMNHLGEIDYLSRLASPEIVVITNAGSAHLEGLGTLANIAEAKSEIINGVKKSGVVVLNHDDQYFDFWCEKAKGKSIKSFGFHQNADVRVKNYDPTKNQFAITYNADSVDINLALAGKHNVLNAAAAVCVGLVLGFDLGSIKSGLENLKVVPGRLQLKSGIGQLKILDDSYNANPTSVKAGIDVLADQPGRKMLVLGEMAELGSDAESLHFQIGQYARDKGIEDLYVIGDMTNHVIEGFSSGSLFKSKAELVNSIKELKNEEITLLVKGSRRMRMEEIVTSLQDSSMGS